jgi:hypothetical protein
MPSNGDGRKHFLRGYEQGLREGFNEVLRLVSQGYGAMEISVLVKSKMAVIHRNVESMEGRLDAGDVKLAEAPAPRRGRRVTAKASYLVRESRADEIFEIARALEAGGARTLLITRMHPNDVRERHKVERAQFLWLTQSTDAPKAKDVAHASATNLVGLVSAVDQFVKQKGAATVAVEGLDYLVSQNGFEPTLKCVQQINEKARARDAFLLLSVDPDTMGAREYGLLAKEIANEV